MIMETPVNFTLKSEKQNNGLFGTPQQCLFIDRMPVVDPDKELLRSAIILSIAQCYPDQTFEVQNSSKDGFCIRLSRSGWIYINYKNYSIHDNIITYND